MIRHPRLPPPPPPPPDKADDVTAAQQRNARLLFFGSLALDIAVCCYYGLSASVDDPLHLYEGLIILALATLPGLLWAKGGGRQLPLFEVLMLTSANCYALPLLSGHRALVKFPEALTSFAGFTVIVYQLSAIAAYYTFRAMPGKTPFFTKEVLSKNVNRYIGFGLTLTTIYTYIATFTDWIPSDLVGVLRAVFFGVGIVAVFVQSRRWGLGQLEPQERFPFLANIIIQVVFQFSTLFLVGGLSIVLLGLIGYVSGARKLPIVATATALLTIALLHNGKAQMRARYWSTSEYHPQLGLVDLPGFFAEWIGDSLTTDPTKSDDEAEMTSKLLDRTSLFHLLCLIQSISPEKKPYLGGETYLGIPGQFVPRFFWPNKPVAHAGTYRLSVYYGLQREEDTARTTIGFGMLNEAYANFGVFGAIGIGVFLGLLYKFLQEKCRRSPIVSYGGLLTIVLMAWSFQTEFTLSLWLSSMFQACVAITGLPFMIRNFLG